MAEEEKKPKKNKWKSIGGVFIPAGLFIGMGIGFAANNVVAGLFIGLGAGFLAFAVASLAARD